MRSIHCRALLRCVNICKLLRRAALPAVLYHRATILPVIQAAAAKRMLHLRVGHGGECITAGLTQLFSAPLIPYLLWVCIKNGCCTQIDRADPVGCSPDDRLQKVLHHARGRAGTRLNCAGCVGMRFCANSARGQRYPL